MLVLPRYLAFCEALTLRGCWWRVGDLRDEICCGGLGHAIHEHANEWSLQDYGESKGKAEKNAFAVTEPTALLLGSKLNTAEIRLKLEVC